MRGRTWTCLGDARRQSCSWTYSRAAKRKFSASSVEDGASGGAEARSEGGFLPGATVATLMMLGALHVRRLFEEKQAEEQRRKGIEPEFIPDWKASFMQLLPLRLISRTWGSLTAVDLPVWIRSYVYGGWARAFHADLEEASLPVEEYSSLRDFFKRNLKEGARPIDPSPACLLSPVDGVVLQCGRIRGSGTMIEQVKGFSYSVSSLLGSDPPVSSAIVPGRSQQIEREPQTSDPLLAETSSNVKSPDALDSSPGKGLFYCVLYLGPGDYHRVHSPADWYILHRRHFHGRLYPVNERAVRTIRNLYVVNERVVLEGRWSQGLMAVAAVGATNVGSIELKIEPELKTNQRHLDLSSVNYMNSRSYGESGIGVPVKAGEEVAAFNLGSTVVLVFEAPASTIGDDVELSLTTSRTWPSTLENNDRIKAFTFSTQPGERVKMGQALGHWGEV